MRVVATWSFSVSDLADGSVGTAAAAGTFCGPRGMPPKYFVVSAFAVARSMSPASTSTALFGP